ncbi:MAG: MFS transporter [Isosphaeraceae bacterium]|nr:MAG: MFS transporter [Isosphaeraceae bacterium]
MTRVDRSRLGLDAYSSLRLPSFRRLLVGAMLATIAAEMQNVALGWELYERTRDPLSLGLIGLVIVVPAVVLALPAGQLADRFSRKRIILGCQLGLASASALLAWISWHRGPVSALYAALMVTGTSLALALPARTAILPQIVPGECLANAVAWRTSSWQLAAVLGPAIGGLGLAWTKGAAAPIFVAGSAINVLVFLILSGIRPRPTERTGERLSLASLLAGVRFVAGNDLILAAITLDLFAVLFGGATFLLPIYARDLLRIGPEGLGWLRAAPSIGATVTAFWIAHRPPFRRAGRALLLAVAGFGLATIVFGLSRNAYLSFAMLLVMGSLDNVSVVIRQTLLQLMTPDAMRGRVSAVNSVFVQLSNELGGFESGLTARWWGPTRAVVVGGLGCLMVVAACAWRWPRLRRLGPLTGVGHRGTEASRADRSEEISPAQRGE